MIYVFSKTCDIELLAYLDIVTRWRESFRRIQHRCGIKRSNLERIDDLTGPLYACVCVCTVSERMAHVLSVPNP